MKAYIITSGVIFGLITVAHLWRIALEGTRLASDPIFIVLTFLAAGLCAWAFKVLKAVPPTR